MVRFLVPILFCLNLGLSVASGQEHQVDKEALNKQRAELREKEKELRSRLAESEQLKAAKELVTQAQKDFEAKKEDQADLVKARAAEKKAADEYAHVLNTKVKASPEASQLNDKKNAA